MKFNKYILITSLIIIVIITFNICAFAYSYPVRRFIEQDKKIRILLHQGIINYSFTPVDKIKVISLAEEPVNLELESGKYRIKMINTVAYWQVQIFATSDKKKAENIKGELFKQGYKDIIIKKEEELYKICISEKEDKQLVEEIKGRLLNDGWNPWIRQIEKVNKDKLLCLVNSCDEILCRGINIIIKGDICSGNKKFPGEFEFLLTNKGIKVFNTVDLNSIMLGILCKQFFNYANPEPEIVKAQTVINRTYILNKLFSGKNSYKNILFYRGIYGDYVQFQNAIYRTEGEVLSGYNFGEYNLTTIPLKKLTEVNIDYTEILGQLFSNNRILNLAKNGQEKAVVDTYVVKGLKYLEIRQLTWWGPGVITVLDMNMDDSKLTVNTHLAGGKIPGLVDLMDTVKEKGALAGINGGFFSYTGRPLGFLMVEGIVVSEPIKNRTVLGITDKGKVLFDRIQWRGTIFGEDGKDPAYITGVNRYPNKDEIVIYNKFLGKKVKLNSDTAQLIILGKSVENVSSGVEGEISVPDNGYIIQARGNKREILNRFCSGDNLYYRNDFGAGSWQNYNIISALGAGPRLLKDGQIYITARQGEFQNDIINGRAPRSAVGITADNHLVFVTVDGRQPELSIGMTLLELASFMKDYGIKDAMNLDGGASARMVVRGYTMNNPSQKRLIASKLIIKIKENQY